MPRVANDATVPGPSAQVRKKVRGKTRAAAVDEEVVRKAAVATRGMFAAGGAAGIAPADAVDDIATSLLEGRGRGR